MDKDHNHISHLLLEILAQPVIFSKSIFITADNGRLSKAIAPTPSTLWALRHNSKLVSVYKQPRNRWGVHIARNRR